VIRRDRGGRVAAFVLLKVRFFDNVNTISAKERKIGNLYDH